MLQKSWYQIDNLQSQVDQLQEKLAQTQTQITNIEAENKNLKTTLDNKNESSIISQGVWTQFIRFNGEWKEASTHFLFIDNQGQYQKANLSQDTTFTRSGEVVGEMIFNDRVWEWDAQFSSTETGTFKLERQEDGSYLGWLYFNDQPTNENRWVKIRDNL